MTNSQIKKFIAEKVSRAVYEGSPYDYKYEGPDGRGILGSVDINRVRDKQMMVCRHFALDEQVLNQAFGIESRLLKNDLDLYGIPPISGFGSHAANLVRIDGQWYLSDPTIPEDEDIALRKANKVFLKPIPDKEIDTNRKDYVWEFPYGVVSSGSKRIYKSHHNMFYRIRDNLKNPAGIVV